MIRLMKRRHSLQNWIYYYGGAMALLLAVFGTIMAISALRSFQSYQTVMEQLTDVQEIRSDLIRVSETLTDYVLSGEGNASGCYSEWQALTDKIERLKVSQSEKSSDLASNLKTYQAKSQAKFDALMLEASSREALSLYEEFLLSQEDRTFLCDMLVEELTEDMAEKTPAMGKQASDSVTMLGVLLFAVIVLTIVFALLLTHALNRPIRLMTEQAEELMEGNYEAPDLPEQEQNELGYLMAAFNEMKHRIRENFHDREEVFRLEQLVQEAELRALQSQVNPHFLFNVLAVATEAALEEDADRTVDIIENISYMLRYSLRSVREEVSLEEEVRMCRAYLFLQKRRFGKRLRVRDELPETMPQLTVPGMTLQPVVENAVKHGIEPRIDGGEIRLELEQLEDMLLLRITDTGCGMPSETLEQIRRGEQPKRTQSTGLGIGNVAGRLNLYYKQCKTDRLLRIESEAGKGTCVEVCYPFRKEGENRDVSDSDHG